MINYNTACVIRLTEVSLSELYIGKRSIAHHVQCDQHQYRDSTIEFVTQVTVRCILWFCGRSVIVTVDEHMATEQANCSRVVRAG